MAGTPYLIGSGNAASGGSTTLTVAVAHASSDGDTILVGVVSQTAGVTPTSVGPDTAGNNYSQILSDTTETGAQLFVWESDGSGMLTTSDTIPVVYSANTSAQLVLVIGDNNISGADKMVIAHGSSTAPNSGSSTTLSQTEEHAIGFIVDTSAGGTPTWAAGWSSNVLSTVTQSAKISAAYQVVNATTALTASGTITSAPWTCAEVTTTVSPVNVAFTCASGVQNEAYSQTLEASGAVSPYTWAITSGSLPTGLSLSSGVISGTPTVAGTYNFTTTATDAHSQTGSYAQTVVIFPSAASGAAAMTLPTNLLVPADSDFETATGLTWAAFTNVSGSPSRVSTGVLTGTQCLKWTAAADGQTAISTGMYPVTGNTSYVASGFILPAGARDVFMGLAWYNSSNSLIRTDYGNDNPSLAIAWQPTCIAGTAPSTATHVKVVAMVQQANAGEVTHVDLNFLAKSKIQVLIDWNNNVFDNSINAGNDFQDATPWTRLDIGISIMRGRQDAISDIQGGSSSFTLQNDNGLFTKFNSTSLISVIGGDVAIGRRCQINVSDEVGNWWTRYDGPIAEIDYEYENTGNTCQAIITGADVMAFMLRQDSLACWTKETVLSLQPLYHWTLDDSGNAGNNGIAAETSGNNGPPMRVYNSDSSLTATIAWQDTSGGVETLADAASAAEFDGSEYWTPGSDQPLSPIRGLDSFNVGPYTSPVGSVYLTPKLTAKSGFSYFIGNTGYQLNAKLPTALEPNVAGNDYTIECWVTMDPAVGVGAIANTKYGPFTAISLGDSAQKTCMMTGVSYDGSGDIQWFGQAYNQPPAWLGLNYPGSAPPAATDSCTFPAFIDPIQLPHHVVVTISGDPTSATCTLYVDTNPQGSFTLAANQVFDTVCIGGAFGGTGCWYGNVSMVSVYEGIMDTNQIVTNCSVGQYGMWESPTDDCVNQIAQFSGVPSFWNAVQGNHNGLSLADYQDITGGNALSAMQIFEQVEIGLIFVNAAGQLMFHTRDWRMGYPGPDLYLPPNTYGADLGYSLIDQYMQNEAAVSTSIFQTGTGFVNTTSQAKYGVYATNPIGSPNQLPLISWNRVGASLGISWINYGSDPHLDDYVGWLANSRADPWLVPTALTIDLLTLDTSTGLSISKLLALEIDNMIAPSGTLPKSFPNRNLSMEWFVEGINETIAIDQHQLTIYTSPAEFQRAWRPGDSVYGVLGSTSRVGISAPDVSIPPAFGKDVPHDSGRPYWAPTITTNNPLNDQTAFKTGSLTGWVAFQSSGSATLASDDGTLYPGGPDLFSVVVTGTGSHAASGEQTGGKITVASGDVISAGAWVYSPAGDTVQVGFDFTISGSYSSTQLSAGDVITAGTWTFIYLQNITVPGGGVNGAYIRVTSTTNNAVLAFQRAKIVPGMFAPFEMNNPADNSHSFLGSLEMRGLVDNVSLQLNPPMCVVNAISQFQTFTTGPQATSCVMTWDMIATDTVSGMGATAGWPNWYTVTVPGFYDIDAYVGWQLNGSGAGNPVQGWIIVAQQAATAVAAGTGTPLTVANYIAPIGSQQRLNANSTTQTINNISTRMYLGVGDMVAVGAQQDTGGNFNSSTGTGSQLSLVWTGYGTSADQVTTAGGFSGSINGNGGTSSGGTAGKATTTKTWNPTATYSYLGNTASSGANTREFNNSQCRQGQYDGGYHTTGDRYSCIRLPASMQTDMGGAATIESITVKCSNTWSWYGTGCYLAVGYSTRAPNSHNGPGGQKWVLDDNDHTNVHLEWFKRYETKTFSLSATAFKSLATSANYLIFGCGASTKPNTNLDHYGWWNGKTSSWSITVKYKK